MTLLGFFASLFGLIYCLGAVYEKSWSWYAGIVNVILYGYYCYSIKLYGELGLQAVYLVLSIVGLLNWNLNKEDKISYSKAELLVVVGFSLLVFAICYIFLLQSIFHSLFPVVDGLLVALSLGATYLAIRKKIENWVIWIPVNFSYVILYIIVGEWPLVIQFLVFGIMAVFGFLTWNRVLNNVQNSSNRT